MRFKNKKVKFSQRLNQYISELEAKTEREVMLESVAKKEIAPGIRAQIHFGPDRTTFDIEFATERSADEIERSIAHEITHALLYYVWGWPIVGGPKSLDNAYVQLAAEVMNLVDNCVINIEIQRRGFGLLHPEWVEKITGRINLFRKAIEFEGRIRSDAPNQVQEDIELISDWLAASTLLMHAELEPNDRKMLQSYLELLPKISPHYLESTRKLSESLNNADILTKEGRNKLLRDLFDILGIEKGIELHKLYLKTK